jgi:CarboxypepD_reg-like domain/X-Pro dipeptidyl-peptidase (S15 family)
LKSLSPFLFFLLAGTSGFTQTIGRTGNAGSYFAGYQNIITTDSARIYKPGVSQTNKFYYRPIEIDLWYPAKEPQTKSPIRYGEFLNLLEQRSNRFQDDTIYQTLSIELLQYISSNLNIRDTSAISGFKTSSWLNAEPVIQHFPLILYMSAFNGMSYENINLFENLATQGYVVACITSVGRYPGNMSTKKADLLEQVDDGAFVMQFLKNRTNIDPGRIGMIGYSWGGLAAWILSLTQKEIRAVLSLDGSEMHYYGASTDEDRDFDSLRYSFFTHDVKNKCAYAYLESGFKQDEQPADSIFNIFFSSGCLKQYIHFTKANHEDFSCLPLLAASISKSTNGSVELYKLINQLSLDYFNQYLKTEGKPFTRQLSSIYSKHMGDSLYPDTQFRKKTGILIKGKIIEMNSKQGLAYVNIGIPDKNRGTVSGRDGSFEMSVDSLSLTDSLKISMVGYKSNTYGMSDLLRHSKPLIIPLQEQETELQAVVVSQKKLITRTLGNTTTSTFVSVGLPLKFLGSEIGVRINLGKKPVLIKNFIFNISDSRLDTAVFRLNIYHFKNGVPRENILHDNILVAVGRRTGKYIIPLSDYKILLKDDILISLEWIEGSASAAGHGAIFLSAAFLNAPTWHRLTSQGKWKKANGLGVGFHIEVQKS